MILATWKSNLKSRFVGAPRLAVAALFGVTCIWCTAAATQQAAGQPVNEFCPVMTEERASPEFTTSFEGQDIGFCCDKCLAKFEANPGRYAGRLGELELKSHSIRSGHPHGKEGTNQSAGSQYDGAHDDDDHADAEDTAQDVKQGEAHDHDHNEDEHSDGANGIHVHEHGHAQGKGFIAKVIGWLGKFHLPMVNFPIAMILGAALAEVLLLATRRSFFANAGRFCLWVGCVGAVVAAVLGWFFGGFHLVDDWWVLTTHRWLGTTTAAWSVLLLVVGERNYLRADATRRRYRALLFLGATLVGISGFFGGSLVYGLNHYAF